MSVYTGVLVTMAMRLDCVYPRDHCDKHRNEKAGDFTRCLPCRVRDEAQRIDKITPRPSR